MTQLDAYRAGLARICYDDVVMCGGTAHEAAKRSGVPLTVALRILVPHYSARGQTARAIARTLGVSQRTVVRHRRLARGRAA